MEVIMVYEKLPVPISEWIDGSDYLNYKNTAYPYWKDILTNIFNKRDKGQSIIINGEMGTGKTTWNVIGVLRDVYEIFLTEKASRPPKGLYMYFSSNYHERHNFIELLSTYFNQMPFFQKLRWFSANNEIHFPDMDFTIKAMSFLEYQEIEKYSLYGMSLFHTGFESDTHIKYIYEVYSTYLIPHLVVTNPAFITWMVLNETESNYFESKDSSGYFTFIKPTRDIIKRYTERGVEI